MIRRADTEHPQRSTHQRQNDRVDAHWTGTQNQYFIANRNLSAFHCMKRGWQGATSRHKSFGIRVQTKAASAGLQINLLGPAAAQSIIQSIGNAINFSLRAARRGFRYQTVPTGVAGSMNVEKRDPIAFVKRVAISVEHRAANPAQTADRNMSGHQRVGNTNQSSLLQVDVGAADF